MPGCIVTFVTVPGLPESCSLIVKLAPPKLVFIVAADNDAPGCRLELIVILFAALALKLPAVAMPPVAAEA